MSKIIYTRKGEEILVDDGDFEWLNQWVWYINDSGYVLRRQHIKLGYKKYGGRGIRMHRLIMKFPKGKVDHEDGNPQNNQRSNLRLATNSEIGFNSKIPTTNTTGYKWICWDKSRQQYHVSTKLNQKKINVGRFNTLEEAIQAVEDKILPLMGKFAPKTWKRH